MLYFVGIYSPQTNGLYIISVYAQKLSGSLSFRLEIHVERNGNSDLDTLLCDVDLHDYDQRQSCSGVTQLHEGDKVYVEAKYTIGFPYNGVKVSFYGYLIAEENSVADPGFPVRGASTS